MSSNSSLDQLDPKKRILLGLALACAGLVAAVAVHVQPERLRAPAWVAFAACSVFVIAGTAVALYSVLSRRAYAWFMAVLLAAMAIVPVWIAVGSGNRHCRGTAPLLFSDFTCRFAFGIGALLMVCLTLWAVLMALKVKDSR